MKKITLTQKQKKFITSRAFFIERCICIKEMEPQPNVFFEVGYFYICSSDKLFCVPTKERGLYLDYEFLGKGELVYHEKIEVINLYSPHVWFFPYDQLKSSHTFPHFFEFFIKEPPLFEPLSEDLFKF